MDNKEKYIAVIILPAEKAEGYYIPEGCEIMNPKPISKCVEIMARGMCRGEGICGSEVKPCEPWCDIWTCYKNDARGALDKLIRATSGKSIKEELK